MVHETRTQLPPDPEVTRTLAQAPASTGLAFAVPTRTQATPEDYRPPGAPRTVENVNLTTPPGFYILNELGRGGMGAVYRAHDLSLDREVALKVLQDKYEADSSAADRFLEESRITSQLQHPGIPAVYQVGRYADGRPFLAMKLIKGRTLDDMMKSQEPMNVLATLEAMAQAVGYAHARKVIHRDLKPQNVMVGAFGEVQVMDWGLAKVIGTESPPADVETPMPVGTRIVPGRMRDSFNTQAGSVMGTLSYMAPEQAAGETELVNERSDVFGLGAILCQMLTGHPPYDGRDFESVRRSAIRGKMDDAMARLDACTADPEVVALCRQCLRFEQAERPANAGALANQIAALRNAADERARQAEVAQARSEVQSAEQNKRRRVILIAANVAIVVLSFGFIATVREYVRAERNAAVAHGAADAERQARSDEAAERRFALEQAEIATEVRQFLQRDLLRQASPMEQAKVLLQGGSDYRPVVNPTIKVLLDRTAEMLAPAVIDTKFPGKPLVQAELLQTLGDTYSDIGEYRRAAEYRQRAAALWSQHKGKDDAVTLKSLVGVAEALNDAAETPEQIPEVIRAFEDLRQRQAAHPDLGPEHADTLASHRSLAGVLHDSGRMAEAIALLERVLEIQTRTLGETHLDTAITRINLAGAHQAAGNLKQAIPLLERTVTALRTSPGPRHPTTLAATFKLADAYRQRGTTADLTEAFKQYRLAYDGFAANHGEDHPATLIVLNGLGRAYLKAKQPDRAIALYEGALRCLMVNPGPEHPNTLDVRNNIGKAFLDKGDYAAAIATLADVLRVRNRNPGPSFPDTLATRFNLAYAYESNNQRDKAYPLYEENATAVATQHFVCPHSLAYVEAAMDCAAELRNGDRARHWHRQWLEHLQSAKQPDLNAITAWTAKRPIVASP